MCDPGTRSEDEEEASDYVPDGVSDSDEDFQPSPPPVTTKPSRKTRTAAKKEAAKKPATKMKPQVASSKKQETKKHPPKKQVAGNKNVDPLLCPQTVESNHLPGSKPAIAACSKPASNDIIARQVHSPLPAKKSIGRRTKWVPPGRVDGKTVDSSPCGSRGKTTGAPVIRVGLSRKARIKPLHQTPLKTKN